MDRAYKRGRVRLLKHASRNPTQLSLDSSAEEEGAPGNAPEEHSLLLLGALEEPRSRPTGEMWHTLLVSRLVERT